MPQSIVSQRFINCLKKLKDLYTVKSDREFCQRIGYTSQNLSQIVRGKRDVTIELVRKAVETFDFNADYIFTGIGKPIKNKSTQKSKGASFEEIRYIPVDQFDHYVNELSNGDSPTVTFYEYPLESSTNDIRLFDIKANSLSPYLSSGDIVICKRIPKNRWQRLIRDHYIHVIVTSEELFFSRVKNQIRMFGEIELLDSIGDGSGHRIINIEELKEIWEITHVISRWTKQMNSESETLDMRLHQLNQTVLNNDASVKDLQQTIEKILKQMRNLNS